LPGRPEIQANEQYSQNQVKRAGTEHVLTGSFVLKNVPTMTRAGQGKKKEFQSKAHFFAMMPYQKFPTGGSAASGLFFQVEKAHYTVGPHSGN
jgi:hypothetical protein